MGAGLPNIPVQWDKPISPFVSNLLQQIGIDPAELFGTAVNTQVKPTDVLGGTEVGAPILDTMFAISNPAAEQLMSKPGGKEVVEWMIPALGQIDPLHYVGNAAAAAQQGGTTSFEELSPQAQQTLQQFAQQAPAALGAQPQGESQTTVIITSSGKPSRSRKADIRKAIRPAIPSVKAWFGEEKPDMSDNKNKLKELVRRAMFTVGPTVQPKKK